MSKRIIRSFLLIGCMCTSWMAMGDDTDFEISVIFDPAETEVVGVETGWYAGIFNSFRILGNYDGKSVKNLRVRTFHGQIIDVSTRNLSRNFDFVTDQNNQIWLKRITFNDWFVEEVFTCHRPYFSNFYVDFPLKGLGVNRIMTTTYKFYFNMKLFRTTMICSPRNEWFGTARNELTIKSSMRLIQLREDLKDPDEEGR